VTFHISHPSLWGLPLYALFYFLGSVVSLGIAYGFVKKNPDFMDVKYFDLMCVTWLVGVLGAKTLFVLTNPDSLSALIGRAGWLNLLEGGYHLFGGILSGVFVFLLLVWKWKLPLWKAIHLLLLVALPGLAIGRIGCVFAGCCYGGQAHESFPILFQYDPQIYATALSLHVRYPVQLFNIGILGALSLFAWLYHRNEHSFISVGIILSGVLFVLGGSRWLEGYYRDPLSRSDSPFWGLYISQWVALSLVLVGGIVGVLWMRKMHANRSKISNRSRE
jgi:phosphatidylglycerol---prolipoprotein diacylglyceryl transferase